MVLFGLCLCAVPARAELQAYPFVGFAVPASATAFKIYGQPDYSTAGASAIGLDLELLVGKTGWRPTAIFWHAGDVGFEYDTNYTGRSDNMGVGVSRAIRLGEGSLAIGAGLVHSSWRWTRAFESTSTATIRDSQTGFLGSARLSAPLSRKLCLSAVAKIQVTDAVQLQSTTSDSDVLEMVASGTTFVLAMGCGWRFGGD